MGDATTLEDYQVTQRNKQNAAGEKLDKDGLIEYFDDMANEWDKVWAMYVQCIGNVWAMYRQWQCQWLWLDSVN